MKIGLISLSGIRVHDQELLKQGLTLPGVVERSRVIASLPNLGLLTLGGMIPVHHDTHYIDIADLSQLKDQDTGFDLVAISSYSAGIQDAYKMASHFRQQGAQVVMGGPHVTCLPDEASCHCDAVILGEGENLWTDMLQDAENKQLKPVYDARRQEFDLAQAPLPAYHLLNPENYNRLTVQTSRGCPLRCEFCASSILITRRYKQKPIDKVLREIDAICSIWRRSFIEFVDDNAFVNRTYWKALLPELKKRKLRWFAETDISISDDDELLKLLKEGGCAQLLIGLESPDETGLRDLETRTNWKHRRASEYLKAVQKVQSHGIRVTGCFIVGLDGHDAKIFDRVYQFSIDSELFDVQITLPTAFPGTPFYNRLKQAGRLLEPEAWEKCTLFDINFRPKPMSVNELEQGFRELGAKLYSESLTYWRKHNFRHYLKGA